MKKIVCLYLALLALAGCRTKIKISDRENQIDSFPAQSPYLTKDNKGNTVMSWIRSLNDSTYVLCFSRSLDGTSFSEPVQVPGSGSIHPHGENLPKIIYKPSGEIIALWGTANPNPANKHSGLVYYTQSFDDGRSWTSPTPLVKDTAGFDQRYYDISLTKEGEVAIIWLDNRKTNGKEGSALYFAATHGNKGFQNERMISQSCCQCCRTDLFIDSRNAIHVLYRGIVQDSIRDMVHMVSSDNGHSFSSPQRISEDNWVINGCPHTGPSMTENKTGLQFSWFTGGKNKGCYYTSSTDNGKTFRQKDSVSSLGSHPQINSFDNGDIFIVWDEVIKFKDTHNKRIGVQLRSADGKEILKKYITGDDSFASYPVVSAISNQQALVAYTKKKEQESYVSYQLIRF